MATEESFTFSQFDNKESYFVILLVRKISQIIIIDLNRSRYVIQDFIWEFKKNIRENGKMHE